MKMGNIHKNQVIITSMAVLIAVAGYLSYDERQRKETMAAPTEENWGYTTEIVSLYEPTEGLEPETELNPGETVLTGNIVGSKDYAANAKMNREQVRSKNKQTLEDVVNNKELSKEQKQEAIDAIVKMTEIAQKEADAEVVLEAKGFKEVVVSITGETCDVILDMGEPTEARRAQIEDIVKRKTGMEVSQIIITPISITD